MKIKPEKKGTKYINSRVEELRTTNINFVQQKDNAIPKDLCEYFIKKINQYIKEGKTTRGYRITFDKEAKRSSIKNFDDEYKNCNDVYFVPQPSMQTKEDQDFYKGFIDMNKDAELYSNINKVFAIIFEIMHYYFLNVGYLGYEYIGATKRNIYEFISSPQDFPTLEDIAVGSFTLRKYTHKEDGGYHIPHFDDLKFTTTPRVLSMIIYLNDIEFGGETEFPVINQMVRPKQGRVGMFPPYYTHTHFGRRATEDKYVFTVHFIRARESNNKEKSK